jgi:hypothetical protein
VPKRKPDSRRHDRSQLDALIRHHVEEAATHLGMIKQLSEALPVQVREGRNIQLAKIGRYLKKLYVHHGGHPDA